MESTEQSNRGKGKDVHEPQKPLSLAAIKSGCSKNKGLKRGATVPGPTVHLEKEMPPWFWAAAQSPAE